MVMRLINSFLWMYMSPNAIWPFMEKFIFQHLYIYIMSVSIGVKTQSCSSVYLCYDWVLFIWSMMMSSTIKPLDIIHLGSLSHISLFFIGNIIWLLFKVIVLKEVKKHFEVVQMSLTSSFFIVDVLPIYKAFR